MQEPTFKEREDVDPFFFDPEAEKEYKAQQDLLQGEIPDDIHDLLSDLIEHLTEINDDAFHGFWEDVRANYEPELAHKAAYGNFSSEQLLDEVRTFLDLH